MLKKIRKAKALDIMKACWKVFLLDKELLIFPLLTLSVLGFLVGGIIWPFWIVSEVPEFLFVLQDDGVETFNNYWMAALVFLTLGSILKTALYVYAVEGKLPDAFDKDIIEGAFKGNPDHG